MTKNYTIGIDLGTTYSCVGIWEDDHVEIILNDEGNPTTPSYVSFTENERLIGEEAKDYSAIYPESTIYDAKRMIGRTYDDEILQNDIKHWPFKVIEKNNGRPYVQVNYKNKIKDFRPEEISSMILSKLKEDAEEYLGQEVTDAVITVPAYFNDAQRKATKDAGLIAGLNVLRIINEPTAAAIAYGLDKKSKEKKNILVVDLGGGTFDVSLLTINNETIEVKATSGDTHLGGEDFDNRLVDHFVKEFKEKYNKDISTDSKALRRLKSACERIKCTLSVLMKANLSIDSLYDGIDFKSSITRECFEELNKDLFEKILEPIGIALKDSGFSKSDIQEIVLVGGSTRIPKIRSLVSEYFDGKKLNKNINPDEAVAYGATILSASLSGIKSEKIKDIVLLDVTPLSLGVETKIGIMSTIIKRNTPIPAKITKNFTTLYDYQTSITFPVYEGERPLTKDNHFLGDFKLCDIPPALHGVPKVDVTMDIDENGILNVSAIDKGTGNYNKTTLINENDRLSKEEIDRIIKEAEKFREEDKLEKERNEAKTDLDVYACNLRVSLKSNSYNISLNDKNNLIESINNMLDWINDNPYASKEKYIDNRLKLETMFNLVVKS
ncbi:heat shock 70 kDa protein cognate 4 [Neocallimastix californiae]|uniref:Heat shock 70 kDa protein cognate 4 n=1 Tax=Neocallimastix californiae TaxID=1754190 RepID=A0A1Y2F2F0_9FUNG|nr:heat shock 70 kDa protein cognate 4 [Neocallimastix californiae]|eukprot:ORY77877.1 heat shock 70 kDa protein cognate 4 [Neocallimastix californiae]